MIFGKKNKEGNIALNASYIDGIKGVMKNLAVQISLDDSDNKLIIKPRMSKKVIAYLSYNQINNIETVSSREIIEKQKNVVGRAVIGGLILGPIGGIVGGISGTGKKKKTKFYLYLVINYISKDGNTEALSFDISTSLHYSNFIKELKQRCNIEDNKENHDIQL